MHPALERMRPAQNRALLLLNVHFGPLDTAGWPAFPPGPERDSMERSLRAEARELLDDEMRAWLEHLERAQNGAALAKLADAVPGLADLLGDADDPPDPPANADDPPDPPANAPVLHQLVALARHVETTFPSSEPPGS